VIVGAGSAGCVLPNRLTEDGRHSVLLLEYGGGDRSVFVRVPSALSIPMNRARYNWGYEIERGPHLNGRRRAERCWADRHRSTGSFTSAAISRIRGIGGGRRRLRDTAGSLFVRPTELVCRGGAPSATPSPWRRRRGGVHGHDEPDSRHRRQWCARGRTGAADDCRSGWALHAGDPSGTSCCRFPRAAFLAGAAGDRSGRVPHAAYGHRDQHTAQGTAAEGGCCRKARRAASGRSAPCCTATASQRWT
jgi:choline dehydrogenase-like flavoprotein